MLNNLNFQLYSNERVITMCLCVSCAIKTPKNDEIFFILNFSVRSGLKIGCAGCWEFNEVENGETISGLRIKWRHKGVLPKYLLRLTSKLSEAFWKFQLRVPHTQKWKIWYVWSTFNVALLGYHTLFVCILQSKLMLK